MPAGNEEETGFLLKHSVNKTTFVPDFLKSRFPKIAGFVNKLLPEYYVHRYDVFALRQPKTAEKQLFFESSLASKLLKSEQAPRHIGHITLHFTPERQIPIDFAYFKPYNSLDKHEPEKIENQDVAKNLEVLALEHLKKTLGDLMIKHDDPLLSNRREMLLASGRNPLKPRLLSEEIKLAKRRIKEKNNKKEGN